MKSEQARALALLGFPLDPDERQASLDEKLSLPPAPPGSDDPYEAVAALLADQPPRLPVQDLGSLEVPGWLRPWPPMEDRAALAVENMVRFIDGEGCRAAACELAARVEALPPDQLPCLVAVEHSLSGGITMALSRRHGPENIALIVLDSHLDAVPLPTMAGAIAFDIDHNPDSPHQPDDPFIFDRADAYCASSFLHHLLAQGHILPQNLMLVGLSDFPPPRALAIKDPRVRAYVSCWTGLQKQGVKIVTKKDLGLNPGKLPALLKQIKAPHVHLSIDMDVGANNALPLLSVRYQDWQGLSRDQLLKTTSAIARAIAPRLAAIDLCEFNPRALKSDAPAYTLAAELIRLFV